MNISGSTWNTKSEMLLEILRVGRNLWSGVREKGGSDEPPNPPWLRACVYGQSVQLQCQSGRKVLACSIQ